MEFELISPVVKLSTAPAGWDLQYPIHPEEENLMGEKFALKRKRDFRLGRIAARNALRQLGADTRAPILIGSNREPLWPEQVVGSITHTRDFAVAAVAWLRDIRALGIDAENLDRQADPAISSHVCVASEEEWVAESGNASIERILRVFSAKEAIYKAFFPICRKYFGFQDVELSWNTANVFRARLLKTLNAELCEGFEFEVSSILRETTIFSWIILPAE